MARNAFKTTVSPPLSILMVCHYFPPHIGGIEFVAYNQALNLQLAGHAVTVVTSRVSLEDKEATFTGIRVMRIKAWNMLERKGVPYPLFSLRLLPTLWRETGKSDVVHIHDVFYLSSIIAACFAYFRHKPIVLMQHVELVSHSSKLIRAIQRMVYATTGHLIFHLSSRILILNDRVNEFIQNYNIAKEKIQFLPNGVDTNLFYPAKDNEAEMTRIKFGLSARKPVALFVGRYVDKKGFHMLKDATDGAYQLVFAGGETDLADTLDTVYLGRLNQAELATLYRAANIFILPSNSEGFPLSIQEAMASGLPVITTDDPGYATYNIDRSRLKLITNPDSNNIKLTIKECLSDRAQLKLMSAYSRNYALNSFSWASITSQLEDVYRQILSATTEQVIVTTSWDDGHNLDVKLSRLLRKYNIPATFYISPNDHEFSKEKLLSDEAVVELSKHFEIGAHTMTHPRLPRVDHTVAFNEIIESRIYLQTLTRTDISCFCYPGGDYTKSHVQMVRKAGFNYARTVKRLSLSTKYNPFMAPTSVNTYNHFSDLLRIGWMVKFHPWHMYKLFHWDFLAVYLFDKALREGGVFHLWGHSWEVDKHGDWSKLETVLKHISGHKSVKYVVNGQINNTIKSSR